MTKEERVSAAAAKAASGEWVVYGQVTYSESSLAVEGVSVTAMDADFFFDDTLGESVTDVEGRYKIVYGISDFRDLFERAPDIYLRITDSEGNMLKDTRGCVVRNAGPDQEIHIQLPELERPHVDVGGVPVDPRAFGRLEPDTFLDIAKFAIHGEGNKKIADTIRDLSPELDPDHLKRELCFTPLRRFLIDAIRLKGWERDIFLQLEDILLGFNPGSAYASFACPNFNINYQTTGSDTPSLNDTGGNITMPGTGAVVGATTGGNGVPDYIEKLCFWLENALATYTAPPFSLANPAASGKIPVNVTGTSAGSAGGGSMTIGRNLNDDLLAAVPTHELMHLIQELYESSGTAGGWNSGMVEGGAVLGEDVVFDTHNRYIVQATTSGTLDSPATSLNSSGARYFLALFLKYISEQQSSRVNPGDEPAIGVETYRTLLEKFDTQGYGDAAFESVVANLPWYQSMFRFGYLDAAQQDETSSETLLGNFWLACYLKDFGASSPDRRFEFMEDEENATWDTIFIGADTVSTLGPVNLTSTTMLNAGGTLTLSAGGSVSEFAARFYRVDVASAIDTLRVDFTAGAGFNHPIMQVILVEPGNTIRDIIRTDKITWSRTIANARGGTKLEHILVVVAGTDTAGSYNLTVQEVAPTPDVMVTRWHHVAGTHYEIDSFGWAWTWVSPDIWVDNDNNGMADSEVFFNQNNKLFIRLRNQGHAEGTGIGVEFWYQNAAGGLSDASWLPVQNAAGVTQSLSGLSLAQGASNNWSVDWAPVPAGTSNHFCIRAVVTVPGDPNVDNKRCLSNFGNVITDEYIVDLPLLRRLPREFDDYRVHLIPRMNGRWFLSLADLNEVERNKAGRGVATVDQFRLRKLASYERYTGCPEVEPEFLARRPCGDAAKRGRAELRPDMFGHYPTDARALPPGLEDVPLVTIVHVVDGQMVGGFTWAIREKQS